MKCLPELMCQPRCCRPEHQDSLAWRPETCTMCTGLRQWKCRESRASWLFSSTSNSFVSMALQWRHICKETRTPVELPDKSANKNVLECLYLWRVTMMMKVTLEHFPVSPYQNKILHIQSDLERRMEILKDPEANLSFLLRPINVFSHMKASASIHAKTHVPSAISVSTIGAF